MSRDRRLSAGGRVLGNFVYGDAGQTAAFLPTLIPDLQAQDDWAVLAYECLARRERP